MNKEKDQKLGDKKFKEGKQNITTGIFNWSKDYASGASNFTEALKYYQSAQCHQKALKTLKQLITCNQKLVDNWAVARNYESIADIYIKYYPETSLEEFKRVATAGFVNFRMSDSIDKGLVMVGRISNHLIKKGNMKEGVALLQDAYKTCTGDQKSYKKTDIFNQIIQVYLENQIYFEAERMYIEEIKARGGVNCDQMGLIVLILILIQGEPKRADKEMYELSNIINNFLTSDECEVGDQLAKAYRKGDAQGFKKLTTKAAVTCIFPIIIIRKLRQIKIPSAESQPPANEEQAHKQTVKNLLF